jgi:uncharacterized delta-60 repeat protein
MRKHWHLDTHDHGQRSRLATLARTALALLLLCPFAGDALAAPGDLDPSFAPNPDKTVWSMAVQPDGRIVVGGSFSTIGGTPRDWLARLHRDGSLDTSFTATTDFIVQSVAVQPNGRILIGGPFTTVNGVIRRSAARLHADGTLDDSFQPDPRRLEGPYYPQAGGSLYDYDDDVVSVAIQPDGKILITGSFAQVGTTARRGIARFHADGSLDSSFNPGANDGATFGSLAVQPDGRILVGGTFTTIGGVPRNRLARLEADGSLDATFNPGASDWVSFFALQPDGKILVGGSFANIGGVQRGLLARLQADGTLDSTFAPGVSGGFPVVLAVALHTDEKFSSPATSRKSPA